MAGDSLTPFRSSAPAPVSPLAPIAPAELDPVPEWWRYLSAVRRFKWLVLGATLGLTALGVGGSLLLKPTYLASATVWIQVPNKELRNEGPIWQGQLPISSGWMQLLQSYAVLDDVVRSQRLYLHSDEPADSDVLASLRIQDRVVPGVYRLDVDDTAPRFTLSVAGAQVPPQRGQVGDSVGAALGVVWVPPAALLSSGRRIGLRRAAAQQGALDLAPDRRVRGGLGRNCRRSGPGAHGAAGLAPAVNANAARVKVDASSLKREKLAELTQS